MWCGGGDEAGGVRTRWAVRPIKTALMYRGGAVLGVGLRVSVRLQSPEHLLNTQQQLSTSMFQVIPKGADVTKPRLPAPCDAHTHRDLLREALLLCNTSTCFDGDGLQSVRTDQAVTIMQPIYTDGARLLHLELLRRWCVIRQDKLGGGGCLRQADCI